MSASTHRAWPGRLGAVLGAAGLAALAAAILVTAGRELGGLDRLAAVALGAAAGLTALLPVLLAVLLWLGLGFLGLDARASGRTLGAALGSRDPDLCGRPFLFPLQAALVFLVTWRAVAFASGAYQRADLAALVVGAAGVLGFLLALGLGALLGPALRRLAIISAAAGRPWLPLASLGASLAWGIGLALAVVGVLTALLWADIQAADPTGVLVLLGLHAAFLLFLAAPLFGPGGRVHRRVRAVLAGLAWLVALLGLLGLPERPVAAAAVSTAPGLDLGLDLGRAVTDLDGDGHSGFFAGGDCAPWDAVVHPGAAEVPDNGVDENCSGRDAQAARYQAPPPRFVDPSTLCPQGQCNAVLITVDSWRADHLSFQGARETVMPAVEHLAQAGAVFRNAYAVGPGTILTVPAMLAGVFDNQLIMDRRIRGPLPVHNKNRLLPESLKRHGVTTLAVLECGYLKPLNQGWTVFDNAPVKGFHRKTTAAARVDRMIALLREHRDRPLFMYAHLNDPHHDYLLHPGHDRWGKDAAGRYKSELSFVDAQLARVFQVIREELTERPTLILITADHGEGFGAHGIKFHNGGLYRELLNVPLIAWHPALTPRKLDAPVSLLDVAPTLRNLFGLKPRPDQVGSSLLTELLRGEEQVDRPVYHQALYDQRGRFYNLVGITRGRQRLLHDLRRNTFELYDLAADPGELRNLAQPGTAVFEDRRGELEDWLAAIGLDAWFVHRPWEKKAKGWTKPVPE